MKSFTSTLWAALCLMFPMGAAADNYIHFKTPTTYKFRVTFADKKQTPYSISRPEEFLSAKSLERRKRMNLSVDEYDLPITPDYLKAVQQYGRLVTKSKWTNTAVVELTDTSALKNLRSLPYVKEVCQVWKRPDKMLRPDTTDRRTWLVDTLPQLPQPYGRGYRQIAQLNGIKLHDAGFRGKGVTIAVIDAGYCNADYIKALKGVDIKGTYNFVHPGRTVYEGQKHGMNVLSCIATNRPGAMIGTAPEASFYLLVSEDDSTEHKVEEDYWCAAVEYADSVGCDVVTSSLGYTGYDDKVESFGYWELDGRTHINSRVASLAASRGIVLLNSAGNSGNDRWKKIGVPADATDMLSVGAVDSLGRNTYFSSLGNTADGRIKPDVMAMGQASALLDTDGCLTTANGTSFSTPILCGLVACLRQAYPQVRPETIIQAVRLSGNNAQHPDNVFGCGIPDMWKAYELLRQWTH